MHSAVGSGTAFVDINNPKEKSRLASTPLVLTAKRLGQAELVQPDMGLRNLQIIWLSGVAVALNAPLHLSILVQLGNK